MTDTNGAHSATVQALTAEVRVLAVGSRQITLSVYRQLDHRPADEIDMFGRVRSANLTPGRGIQLVGRAGDGALVASTVYPPDWTDERPPDEFFHWLEHDKRREPEYFAPITGSRLRWKCDRRRSYCTAKRRRDDLPDNGADLTPLADIDPTDRPRVRIAGLFTGGYVSTEQTRTRIPLTVQHQNVSAIFFNELPLPHLSPYDEIILEGQIFRGENGLALIVDRIVPRHETVTYVNEWLQAEYCHYGAAGEFCDIDALYQKWVAVAEEQTADLTAEQELYDTAKALPLIVLAGLR